MLNSFKHLAIDAYEPVVTAVAALVIVGFCFFIFVRTYWIWHVNHLRRRGFDISRRNPTLFDVRELLIRNEKRVAVRVYRQIFKVDQKEAQLAVDNLEKNLHQKG